MNEIKLYKLLVTADNYYETALADEIRWTSDGKLLAWISYLWIAEFMHEIIEMFGYTIFDDGSFDGNFQNDCICIDLEQVIGGYIQLEDIFPKDKYSL